MVRIPSERTYLEIYITPDNGFICYNKSRDEWRKPHLDINSKGYRYLRAGDHHNGCKPDLYFEHIEVANAFVPKRNIFCTNIHHLDMDKNNNDADNLIWLTPSEHHYIHNQARRGEYTTMIKVLEEEREFCRENGIRFSRKININQLKSKINEYYSQKSKAVKSND